MEPEILSAEQVEERFESWKAKVKEITITIEALSEQSNQLGRDLGARIAQNCCKKWSDELKQETIILYEQLIEVFKQERRLLGSRQYKLKKSIERAEADRKNVEDHYTPLLSFLNSAGLLDNSTEQKEAEPDTQTQAAG